MCSVSSSYIFILVNKWQGYLYLQYYGLVSWSDVVIFLHAVVRATTKQSDTS